MYKNKLTIGLVAVLTTVIVGAELLLLCQNPESKVLENNMVAMYIENENGYEESKANVFPTDGYVLNTEKSECQNGGILTQNPKTKSISLSVSKPDQCKFYFDKEKLPLVQTLLGKANASSITNYSSGNMAELYTFDHGISSTDTNGNTHEATQISSWSAEQRRDYRYIGSNPNNYIRFNDELWRIIGLFTVEKEDNSKEQLVKIMREETIGDLSWGTRWDTSNWLDSPLRQILIGDYYNATGDYSLSSNVKGLNSTSQKQIEKVKWYLGSIDLSDNLSGEIYYADERKDETNTLDFVGLIYPSDYLYMYSYGVDDICFANGTNCATAYSSFSGWMSDTPFWTITVGATSHLTVFKINADTGYVFDTGTSGARPSVYLKSNVVYTGGDGSSSNPYLIQ